MIAFLWVIDWSGIRLTSPKVYNQRTQFIDFASSGSVKSSVDSSPCQKSVDKHQWIEEQIGKGKFGNFSHVVEVALEKLRAQTKSSDEK